MLFQNKLDNLSSLVADSLSSCKSSNRSISADTNTLSTRSRELNVIVFGIAENRDRCVCNKHVLDVLQYVTGRDVDIANAFRLRAFKPDHTRPVLVTLRSAWDKRLLLANCRKLATSDGYMKKVFIVADEPVKVRRKKVLQRMKVRACQNNQNVDVSPDGCYLYVDGNLVYSVKDGLVSSHNRLDDGQ